MPPCKKLRRKLKGCHSCSNAIHVLGSGQGIPSSLHGDDMGGDALEISARLPKPAFSEHWVMSVPEKELIQAKGTETPNTLAAALVFLPSQLENSETQSIKFPTCLSHYLGRPALTSWLQPRLEGMESEDGGNKVGSGRDMKGLSGGNTAVFAFPLLALVAKISECSPPRTLGLHKKQNFTVCQ